MLKYLREHLPILVLTAVLTAAMILPLVFQIQTSREVHAKLRDQDRRMIEEIKELEQRQLLVITVLERVAAEKDRAELDAARQDLIRSENDETELTP